MTKSRFVSAALFLLGFGSLISCAEGAPAFTGAPTFDAGSGTVSPMPGCGNGIVEDGENCDCKNLTTGSCIVTDPAQSCQSMMNESGTLLCDAQTCMFNTTMCHSTMDAGGSGTGG